MPEEVKHYVLKSKDRPLLYFDLLRRVSEIDGVEDESYFLEFLGLEQGVVHGVAVGNLLPKGLVLTDNTKENSDNLLKWLKARRAPKDRQYIQKVLDFIGKSKNPLKYVDVTYGLSLNDAYWIADTNDTARWEDVNLYTHPLDEVVARIAFTGVVSKLNNLRHRSTPELSSGGAMRKCWVNKSDGGIYLWKAEEPMCVRDDRRSAVVMEYYAAQVAEAMGLDYVPYSLVSHREKDGITETICECPLFTSEDIGFVDAAGVLRNQEMGISYQDLFNAETHRDIAKVFGEDFYADMMLYDSIILNTDRHLGNFGLLMDNDTGEYLGPAPLFDNGSTALVGIPTTELSDMDTLLESESCSFGRYLSFDEQAAMFVEQRHIPILEGLTEFELRQTEDASLGATATTLEALNYAIRYRSRRAIDLFAAKQQRRQKRMQQNNGNEY